MEEIGSYFGIRYPMVSKPLNISQFKAWHLNLVVGSPFIVSSAA